MSGSKPGPDKGALVRALLHMVPLSFILAAVAVADPDSAPQTATAAATLPAAKAPASERPTEVQSPPPAEESKPNAKMTPAEIKQISDTYFKQCMQDWDAGTHMTKQDWERTCRRVVDNRVKFLIEQVGK